MKALTHISGSFVVLEKSREHYIDARSDTRYPGHSFIEVVRSGQVRRRECVPNAKAPERIIELAKEEFA